MGQHESRPAVGLAIAFGATTLLLTVVALALQPSVSTLPVASFVDRFNLLLLGGAAGFGLPGAVIAAVRPRNRIGWLAAAIGLLTALALATQQYGIIGVYRAPELPAAGWAIWVSTWVWAPAYWLIPTLLLLLFPDRRLVSARWLPAAWAAWGAVALSTLGWALDPASDNDTNVTPPGYHYPVPTSAEAAHLLLSVGSVLGVLAIIAAVVLLLLRYRRAVGVERLQISWVLVGGLATVALLAATFAGGRWLIGLAMLPLPLAISVAVVHTRLWNIELVLNRSLTYGILTVGIAALYLMCVLMLGNVVGATTGAPLIATALAAIVIQPAHARVRRWANQVVYGDRDDPAAALRRLGERLDGVASPDESLLAATQSVARALRCAYVAIEADGIVASSGSMPYAREQRFPLAYAGETIGALVIGTLPGASVGRAERRLIDDLAPHLGVVLHANRLTRDLHLSRQRLLAARDDERRRLQRELHDGLGATLAALALQVDRGRGLLAHDPARAASVFDELGQRIRETVGTVRGIVQGLRPPDLDQLSLAGALEILAERLTSGTLHMRVCADRNAANLPAAVELAVYRIASEAMTNASRHAHASCCEVRLEVGGQRLELSVTDDGQGLAGGASSGAGTGLRSMRERAEELAGTCSIASVQPHGTRVSVRIPLPEDAL